MQGKLFNNRYELREKIGAGGTAIVYKGQDLLLSRPVTIKILREEYANDEEFVRRFRQEAQGVAILSHGNIVSVYDVGYEDNMHYIVMEYVKGNNLKEYIKSKGALPLDEAINIMCQILDAIEYAHEHNIVHRDIKPHNILFAQDGRVKVTDFGIAVGMSDFTMTYNNPSRIMGSVQYISPEQVQGQSVNKKSDIYSLGVVLYEMLTGTLPFQGDSPINIAMQHVQGEIKPPHQLNTQVPVALSYIVMRAMRKNPDIRFASAKEMKESILSVAEGINTVYQPLPFEENNDINKFKAKKAALNNHNIASAEKQKKPVNMTKRIILIASVIMVIALFIIVWQVLKTLTTNQDVEVPQLVGIKLEQAENLLKDRDLLFTVSYANDPTVEKDYVISQDITAGQIVRVKRSIGLVVSLGPTETTVPSVVGLALRDAILSLENHSLTYDSEEAFDDDVEEGKIISQYPEANASVAENSSIKLTVSKGREPKVITMPDILGKTLSEAKTVLDNNNLDIGEITYQESNNYNQGLIISQGVVSGLETTEGTSIDVVISKGPGPQAKIAIVTYEIPDDGEKHDFRIVVDDVTGTHEEYSASLFPGTSVNENVTYYNKGKIMIYLDGEMVYANDVS